MNPSDHGMPPIALLQLLEGGIVEPDATSRFWAIMDREGVDLRLMVARGDQVPLRWFHEVYPQLDVGRATALGVTFAEEAQLTTVGSLSIPLISAGSVADVVELLTYAPVITTALSTQFHPSERGLMVGLSGHTNDPVLDCLAVAYGGYVVLRLLDILTGKLPDVTLNLSWSAPPSMTGSRQVAEGRIRFGAPTSYLQIPTDTLEKVCRFSDPVTYRVSVDNLKRVLADRTEGATVADRVRRLVERNLAGATTGSVALDLSMSVSTLKRRLSDEGTSFSELRQALLRARATLLLLDRGHSVSEIAADLGYSDVANFSHAFKRWTGRSPRDFRSSGSP
jgi:AraC-like DNA-binding protein